MKTRTFLVKPGNKIDLARIDPSQKGGYADKQSAQEDMENNLRKLEKYQDILHTQTEHGLLIVLQALDAGGKDGTIRHVMGAFNPMGCSVVSFKVPTVREALHDFLWRIHPHTPARGRIAIFNRSHYEDVLVARVHKLVPKKVWSGRYGHINAFEKLIAESGIVIRKFFLHISRDEQRTRLEERLHDPSKNWKFDHADLDERGHWDGYVEAYEDVFKETSTPWAPWYVVPANHKWFRNLLISEILVETFKDMKLKYPPPVEGLDKLHVPE